MASSEASQDDPGPSDPRGGALPFRRIFVSLALPLFMALIDQTIVAAALPAIAGDFGDLERISWIVVSYLIASTVAAPVYGRLGDVLGRRRMLFIALAIFSGASLVCAAAPNMAVLVAGRTLQGLGGGGLITLVHALVGQSVPPRERARYQGYLAAVMVTATSLGPSVGGFLSEHLGWRSIFMLSPPLTVVAAILVLRLPAGGRSVEPFRFDFLGLALLTILVASLVVMISLSRSAGGMGAIGPLALLCLAAVAGLLLWRWERVVSSPLVPLQLFGDPCIWRSDAIAACHGATLVSLLSFMPLYLVVARDFSVSEAGLLMLPFTVCIGIGAAGAGRIVSATGHTALFPSIGMTMICLIMFLLAVMSTVMSTAQLMTALALSAAMMGATMSTLHVIVLAAADPAMLGAAAGALQLTRALGAAIGTALVGTVLFWVLMRSDPEAAGRIAAALATISDSSSAPAAALRTQMGEAFRFAFGTIGCVALVGAVLGWTIPVRRIR